MNKSPPNGPTGKERIIFKRDGRTIDNHIQTYTLFFISNTFISNARLKLADFENLFRKITRSMPRDHCKTIVLIPNSSLNTFL